MSLPHLLLGAAVVAAWFIGWGMGVAKVSGTAGAPRYLREGGEAVLLTMFAALWFGSLGHGQWWVLFIVLGLLMEGPVLLRHRPDPLPAPFPWRSTLLGLLRLLGAGALLNFLL